VGQISIRGKWRRDLGGVWAHVARYLALFFPPWFGFANQVIRPLDYTNAVLPEELLEYAPFFDGCIGAVDNTHIDVIVDEEVCDDHINRHGDTTQKVLAVCDFNMRFVYIAAGTEGSAYNMRVKKKAELDPYFPHPPLG
jgi:hypothetical protein